MALHFTKEHSWIADADGIATVGITDFAQAQLGDITFVELPPAGTVLEKDRAAATVESIKAASDILSPLSGTVIEANAAVEADPSLLNVSPERDGWLFRMRITQPAELDGLLDAARYRARVALL